VELPLVSVIMPARNAGSFIREAIGSMLAQTWPHWELIVVENGSTDRTGEVIASFHDPRIRHLHSPITGLCHARNLGLAKARGSLLCFLDADDRLPHRSIEARATRLMADPQLRFVDGIVETYDERMERVRRIWRPSFRGIPFLEMGKINPGCFSAISWMIRRSEDLVMEFDTSWTHLEDRVFFLSIAHAGAYDFVEEPCYHIRRRAGSLMSEHGYMEGAFRRYLARVRERDILSADQWKAERRYFHRMFARAYAREGHLAPAIGHAWSWLNIRR
jgi:glycosyltransferase involved in cell wall biosynthesis